MKLFVFLLWPQLVEHIGQCFCVHQPMFICDMEEYLEGRSCPRGSPIDVGSLETSIDRLPNVFYVLSNLCDRWPILRLVRRQPSIHRIDPKREQPVELRGK